MNYFISLQKSQNQISYFFNKNHFLILLLSLVIIIFFSMYVTRQNTKKQKNAVFFITFILVLLEGLKIFWNYKFLQYNNEQLNFFSVTNLDFFTLSLYISIPILLFSAFYKKKNKHNIYILNFVFDVCGLFAVISLIYPVNINTYFEFYHCYNLIYMLQRSFVIMLSLTFVFAKWITVENFLDLWKSLLSLAFLFVACYIVSCFNLSSINVFYFNYVPVFESLGLHLIYPWHIVLMFAFLFIFQVVLHLPFFILKSYKIKHGKY